MKLLERHTIFTPLGLRFWDPVTDQQVGNDLIVTARPEEGRGLVTRAFRTASNVYAFQGLPGLREVEYPSVPRAPFSSPLQQRGFVIEITDARERFLPTLFTVQLPLAERGLYFGSGSVSPPGARPPGFYLFSASTRPVPSGFAAIRADLFDFDRQSPAAHALMEIEISSRRWFGLSDSMGRVAVLLPWPESNLTLGASPPKAPPLPQQQWPLSVRVRYEPDALRFPVGARLPDLRSIRDQSAGLILTTEPGSPPSGTASMPAVLNFGQELVLRTGSLPQFWIASG